MDGNKLGKMIDSLIKVKAGDIVKTNQGEFTVTNVMKLLNPFTLMEEIGIMIEEIWHFIISLFHLYLYEVTICFNGTISIWRTGKFLGNRS